MPELPEVEVLKLSLSRLILNSRITKVEINNRNLRYKLPNNFSRALQGNILKKIKRRAKYVIFVFAKKYSLLIHLGMSGVIFLIRNIRLKIHIHGFFLIILYTITGIIASICSIVFSNHLISVGASGSILGLFGFYYILLNKF